MGDDQDRLALRAQPVERLHHRRFGRVVERAGRFVEHQHRRLLVDRAGEAEPLSLPARQPHAMFADDRVIAIGQGRDEFAELGDVGGARHSGQIDGGGGHAERDVAGDAGVGKEDRLRNMRDVALPAARGCGGQRDPVDADRAAGRFEQAHEDVGQRALAAAGAADHGHARAFANDQVDRVERGLRPTGIGEANRLEPNLAGKAGRRGWRACFIMFG